MIHDDLTSLIIDEAFIKLPNFVSHFELIVKLENLNLAGSVKLKAAKAMIEGFENQGRLKPGYEVIESSSGNLGVALAMVCAAKGYPFTCVTDPNVSPQNLNLMRSLGAKVIMVEHAECGGFVAQRLAVIKELLAKNPKLVWTDQYSNTDNINIHYQTTAPAILNNIPDIDYLFLGVGSSGTIMGCCQYFKQVKPDVKIIAVDPKGSVLFGDKAQRRFIPGIGGSVVPKLLDKTLVDDYVTVSEKDTLKMCQSIVKDRGWLIGGSTATNLAAIKQYQDNIEPFSKVVTIAADIGGNYLETLYNPQWVDQTCSYIDYHQL